MELVPEFMIGVRTFLASSSIVAGLPRARALATLNSTLGVISAC